LTSDAGGASVTESAAGARTGVQLVRGLGLLAATAILIGDVVGTGVFLKARVMTCNVGSPSIVLAVWVVGGLLSLAGALTYAELAAMMPRAGGEYVFIREGYGRLPAFLYGWTRFFVASTGSTAALAAGFAIFLNIISRGAFDVAWLTVPIGGRSFVIGGLQAIAVVAIVCVTIVNCAAVAVSGRIAMALTGMKIALICGVGVAAVALANGDWGHYAMSAMSGGCADVAPAARGGFAGFGAAMLGAMWAYNGWNEITYVAEEVKDPQRNLPRAIIVGIGIIAVLYIGVNATYFFVLTPAQIIALPASASVASEVVLRSLGAGASGIMAGAMAASIFGSLLLASLVGARIPFAMSRDGVFVGALAHLSPRTRVPVRALVAQAIWAGVLVLSGSYDTITDYAIFAVLIFVALSTASVFVFRRRLPDLPRAYRTWGYPVVPVLFLLVAIWILINTLITTPGRAVAGLGLMAAGLPFYWYWTRAAEGSTAAAERRG